MCIDGAENIVHDQNASPRVNSTCDGDAPFLASAEIYSVHAKLCLIAVCERFQVLVQGAGSECFLVSLLIERQSKENVVLEGGVFDPRGLTNICESSR